MYKTRNQLTARVVSCAILAPACQPLALVRIHDGSTCLRLRCPWIPAKQALWVRLPESRRLSPLQPVENQSRGWGIGCHLGT